MTDRIKALRIELRRVEMNWIAGRATDAQLRAAKQNLANAIGRIEFKSAGAKRK